jgi:CRP-like cAMP-binding protein
LPVARNYKPGSIVYFENDKSSEEIYILQNGKVALVSSAIDTDEEIRETISDGEFFGVKSSLGKYPREETAQVLTPTVVLVVTQEEFEQMVMKNFRVLIKMLKVFSNQLRRIGKKVRDIMHKGEPKMPSTELYFIGEYYFKQ